MDLFRLLAALVIFSSANAYRLPGNIIPSKYVVDLFIPEGTFTGQNLTFEGEVNIQFRVSNSTTQIKIHHKVAEISQTLLSSTTPIPILNATYNKTTEIYTITLSSALSVATDYNLYFKYYSIFETTTMKGFYTSTYKDENNQTAYLITTQFEPTHARHAFPCFDEPQYKAKFAISLTYPTGLNALSNTGANNSVPVDSTYTKTNYQETTTMSTYLIAFIISNFTCTKGDTIESGVPHRVCSRDEEKVDRTWAVEIGTPLLRTLESITGIKYGSYMPKMDQVAIPDFSAGAMENWGLVTYRETGLLYNEEDTSNVYKKNIALVIAHEFTHMWFGNLVTCKWWDYTFLNEGFARFYQYFAAAATKQMLNWELDKHFNVEQVHTALLVDSTLNAQALTSAAASPTEISGKFTTISYNKGASILRMIETNIMGADNFIYGIRKYLTTHQLTGTVPSDLWSSLADFVPSNALPSGVSLSTVLNNWVELSGHPVVKVAASGKDIILTQERFLLQGNASTQYYIPITYTLSSDITKFSNTTVKNWLSPGSSLTLSGALDGNKWIILNNRQSGFYRVDYDNTIWSALKAQLHSNHLAIDVLNRAQIISDAYNFARSGRNGGYGKWTYSDTLDVLSYLQHEEDYYPWYATIVGNNHLLQRIGYDSPEGKLFTNWMLRLMQNVYKTVPFDILDSSNQLYTMKQILILIRACKYGEASCIQKSKELFANYRVNGVKVPKNLRTIVYCTALKHSDNIQIDFNFLWQKYSETKLMSEILTILNGLGCAQDAQLLKWYLGQTINSTSGIRLQDFTSVWSYVYSSSKTGTNAALEYIAENYAKLNESYDGVASLISNIAGYIYDEDQLEKLEALYRINEISAEHNSTVQNALSSAKSVIVWATMLKQDVRSYLEQTTGGASSPKSSCALALVFLCLAKLFF